MRVAVILLNLGGPDAPEAVRPFLRNLFRDRAIIDLPSIVRLPLASLIAARRARIASAIYAKIGGRSPILPQTLAQARALDEALAASGCEHTLRSFVCMRYWHPMAMETVEQVRAFAPDHIVLLPLYPQLSTSTTASSINDWHATARAANLTVPTQAICCYPELGGFIAASAKLIAPILAEEEARGPVRLLFSAHGLPERIVARGDPYPGQVARTAGAIAGQLARPNLDWILCYQSRVGPLKWIGPSTDTEIERAAKDKRAIVLFPLSFVSEHSETLVELDIEYRELAHRAGAPGYRRVQAVGITPAFISGLASLVLATLARPDREILNEGTGGACGEHDKRCALRVQDTFARVTYGAQR